MTLTAITNRTDQNNLLRGIWKGRAGYAFILPLFAFFIVFKALPIARSVWLVFMEYDFLKPSADHFVGLANFVQWAQDPRVLHAFWISIKFFLMSTPPLVVFGLLIALAIDRIRHAGLATLYRVLCYLPVVLPASILYYIWLWMYNPSWGVIDHILITILGINWPWPGWLSDPTAALPALAIMTIWEGVGGVMMLFLVGLNSIPGELYEAARIDGANEWQIAWHVTLPLLQNIFLIVTVLRLQVLGAVVQPLLMTQGGPINATMTYGLQAYYISFRDGNWDMGYGTTWFLILGLLSTGLAYVAWRTFRMEAT